MPEKLLIVHGGKLGSSSTPQVNEEVEIPSLPEGFERKYAPDVEPKDTDVVLPRGIKPKADEEGGVK